MMSTLRLQVTRSLSDRGEGRRQGNEGEWKGKREEGGKEGGTEVKGERENGGGKEG